MKRFLASFVVALVTVLVLPDTAGAQVYPERITIAAKVRAMSPDERAAFIQKRREERAKAAGNNN